MSSMNYYGCWLNSNLSDILSRQGNLTVGSVNFQANSTSMHITLGKSNFTNVIITAQHYAYTCGYSLSGRDLYITCRDVNGNPPTQNELLSMIAFTIS